MSKFANRSASTIDSSESCGLTSTVELVAKTDRSAESTRVRMVAQGATELYASMGAGRSIRRLEWYLACRATIVALTPRPPLPLGERGSATDIQPQCFGFNFPLLFRRVIHRCRRDATMSALYVCSELGRADDGVRKLHAPPPQPTRGEGERHAVRNKAETAMIVQSQRGDAQDFAARSRQVCSTNQASNSRPNIGEAPRFA